RAPVTPVVRPPRPPRPRPAPRPAVPEPAPGPSHTAVSGRPVASTSTARPRSVSPTTHTPREKKEKTKTRGTANPESESNGSWSTTDGDSTETEGVFNVSGSETVLFSVSQKVYDTFDQYLGSNAVRTDVPWIDFRQAMSAIGFEGRKTSGGSSWKFYPTGNIENNETITIHEPHPDSSQRPNQVSWTGKRLKRSYGLNMSMFAVV
ncbi:hypothetical protein P7C70_g8315, partial [Phenoliferia sp. Uapishka_3]